ncbi:hypothetical protein F2Q69_00010267 [Brassica cretica]|uniref:Hexosyltransferase n=1 Tax=Brassica cretica TaxID=69181 RepID=A0A8S9R2X2_BRACR|nr:hypothetical protein F2Q69_00010267 [Brassica cretica]
MDKRRRRQVLNDTPEKLYQRRMRQERREKRANELMNNDNIEALEKAAIQRSMSVDSVAIGNYSIWRNDYRKSKNFEDLVLDTIRDMGQLLARAKSQLHDCNLVTNKLRAMLQTAEEELLHTQTHVTFLNQLASKSVPDAIHCLTMRLNLDYSLLPSPLRHFPGTENLENPNLHHYALFSDNVLAASVVSDEHVVPAKPSRRRGNNPSPEVRGFLLAQSLLLSGTETARVRILKKFYFKTERSESAESGAESFKYRYPKYLSMLNHLRFYIPKIFLKLEKILFLADDVVVQKDLAPLWEVDLKGKVNGGVETCGASFHRLKSSLNFSDGVCQRVNQELCGMVEAIWIQDAELAWDKLEEQVYTVEKKARDKLGGQVYALRNKWVFLDRAEAVAGVLTMERQVWRFLIKQKMFACIYLSLDLSSALLSGVIFTLTRVSERFDPEYCGWAYGMNVFDLRERRKNNITETYHFWQNMNENMMLWKLGTLPPGLIAFYGLTRPLQKKWHLLGLG